MNNINIVNEEGKPNFGIWNGQIQKVNFLNYNKTKTSKFFKYFREKRWQYIGLYGEKVIIGLAIIHTGYLGNVFWYIFDRETASFIEKDKKIPFGIGIRVDRNVAIGISSYRTGEEYITINNDITMGFRRISAKLKHKNKNINIEVSLHDNFKDIEPLQVVTPTGEGNFTFTHKAICFPVQGFVSIDDRAISFNSEKDFSVIDYTFGFPDYSTLWNWCSLAGKSIDGVSIGVNLVAPIFHNDFNENVIWINGVIIKTDYAIFKFTENTMKPWEISTVDGKVELIFMPLGKRQQDIDLFIISSRFQQPYGIFSGTIRDNNRIYTLRDVPGVVEYHEAHW